MEWKGARPAGVAPTATLIRVNAQGREHMQAVVDQEGGAGVVRRRAHRVRARYQRTVRGSSRRKAHVRGRVNATERVVGAVVADQL